MSSGISIKAIAALNFYFNVVFVVNVNFDLDSSICTWFSLALELRVLPAKSIRMRCDIEPNASRKTFIDCCAIK